MHVNEEPFTQEKWTCGQTIYSTMDHRGSFLEHSVGQDGIHGPHYGSHGEMYCPAELDSGNCFVKYKDDHWLKQQVISTDYDNYAVMYRCLPQHGSYVTLLSRTPELDNEFLENIMFRVQYMLPNFNFQTLVRDIQGYHQCNYQAEEHHYSHYQHPSHAVHHPAHAVHHPAVAAHLPSHDVHHDFHGEDYPHDYHVSDDHHDYHGDDYPHDVYGDFHHDVYGDYHHDDYHGDDYHHDTHGDDYLHDAIGDYHHDYHGDDYHHETYGDDHQQWLWN